MLEISSHVFTVMVPGSCIQGFKFWGSLRVFLVLYLCFMVIFISLFFLRVYVPCFLFLYAPLVFSFSVLVSFLSLCL